MSPRRKGKKKVSLKSRQHDEYAILNYYDKQNKYELDRGNLKMRDAIIEKQKRRVENAKAKREMIRQARAVDNKSAVATKVNRIRDISVLKDQQKTERRENAIRHQEMLKSFLDEEKAHRMDERPIQYGESGSAFGPNTSVMESRGGSRSASRSPMRGGNRSRSVLSNQKSAARTVPRSQVQSKQGNNMQHSDLIAVRTLDFGQDSSIAAQ